MISMETRATRYCCVINAPIGKEYLLKSYISIFEEELSKIGLTYYAIIHDRDKDKNGDMKTSHIHLIITRGTTRTRAKWLLTRLSELLNIEENNISIQSCEDLTCSVQYLIHKNNKNKEPYERKEISTNAVWEKVEEMLDKDISLIELTFEDLIEIYEDCGGDKLAIMKRIGLGRYQAYARAITDFYRVYEPIYYAKEKREEQQSQLPF